MNIYAIESENDVIGARHFIRDLVKEKGFGLIDQTRLTTITSELVRNIVLYAGKGQVLAYDVMNGSTNGIKIEFKDSGPGIQDIEQAMQDGYTTKGGLGAGLPGSKRLSDEFYIESESGKGTKITVIKWLKA
ncbi:MAG: anti-sigma regulatory factor [Bacteroidetes bacterium]|nr:anti-sigma regulatory factor [Bacteroidota bacterium]MBL6963819.1 anti-sigma regulatory factor [Bacteroidota bacterium]